jgi:glycosyltransferase involved in cell wall biosynthesis
MKPRILWCGEFSQLKTGYAVYAHEVLSRWFSTNKYELAEHASYAHRSDPRIQNVPWQLYANLPDSDNQEEVNRYNSSPTNQFGEWRFEDICIDFKPHIVVSILDFWMMSNQYRSPFRQCFNLCQMPTCDAYPQNEEWISSYESCDGIFTYQDWSKQVLDFESAGKIKTLGSASPAADSAFQPMDREAIKRSVGLENYKIVGTVMRNQRRKLFPDLFGAFKVFLETSKRTDILLYCHTSYPDMGWDIPKLLLQYGLASKVLFTYVCRECGHAHPNFFNDALMECPQCKRMTSAVSNVQSGVDNKCLAAIMNMFDLCIGWSNSEGCGIPILEASACGTPCIGVDYSAMSDTLRKLGGIPIKPIALTMELETGCFRAVPDNDALIDKFDLFFNKLTEEQRQTLRVETRKKYLENYSWDTTAKKWESYFDKVDIELYERRWHNPPLYTNIPTDFPKGLSNPQFAKWLITNVLGEPRYLNSYMESRLIRDLNYEVTNMGIAGMYFNDQSALFSKPNWTSFNQETAFKHFRELGNRKNFWENKRWEKVKR